MIHIYTGEGKGKTTAAMGAALRALGWGYNVCICQFLKSNKCKSGEISAFKNVKRHNRLLTVKRFNQRHPIFCHTIGSKRRMAEALHKSINKSIAEIRDIFKAKKYKVIILDEVINSVSEGFVKEDLILDLINSVPKGVELILTGRGATKRMIDMADYVTDMKLLKHPFYKKVKARKGIEY